MVTKIVVPITDEYPRNGEGSLFVHDSGKLSIAFTRFHTGTDDENPASIWLCESSDGGGTWSNPEEIIPNRGRMNTMSTSLLFTESFLLMAVLVKDSTSSSRIEFFAADGDNLRSLRNISSFSHECYIGMHNDRLTASADGTIFLPISLCVDSGAAGVGNSKSLHFASSREAGVLSSSDSGTSWQMAPELISLPGRGAMEPCVHFSETGNLLMTMRTQLGSIYISSYTKNGWIPPQSMGIASPEAPHTLKRSPHSGLLYLLHCPTYVPGVHHFGPRFPLVLRVSRDDGISWSNPVVVASGYLGKYEYANASMCFTSGKILMTYYSRHLKGMLYNKKDLLLTVATEKEIRKSASDYFAT